MDDNNENKEVEIAKTPEMPSQQEINEHNARGHVPYRSWRKHCVMGQGKDSQHRAITGEEQTIITVSMDYGFMTEADKTRPGAPPMVGYYDRISKNN